MKTNTNSKELLQKLGNTGILAETRKEKMSVGVSICGSYANFVS